MSKKRILFLSLLLCVIGDGWCSESTPTSSLPGHMQPLGSHMEPKQIVRINHMPTPQEFQEKYVAPKKPVIFEGLMSDLDVIKNWQSDNYLRTHFGDISMDIDIKKKENRSLDGTELTMKEFLDKYNESDIYMISNPPLNMYNEWQVPRFMLCGGFMNHIHSVVMWFSSGGTKSVVHADRYENLHCLVSGTKKFVMIEPRFNGSIGPEKQKGFYDMDVDQVDMTVFPNLAKIPWYQATVNAGDCFYLPYLWVHQVNSEGRNMGINVWWNLFNFDSESCPSDERVLPDFASLENYELEAVENLKKILNAVKRDNGSVYAQDLLKPELTKLDTYLLLELLQPGCRGVILHVDEIPVENLRYAAVNAELIIEAGWHSEYDPPSPGNDLPSPGNNPQLPGNEPPSPGDDSPPPSDDTQEQIKREEERDEL